MNKLLLLICAITLTCSNSFAKIPSDIDEQISIFTKPYQYSEVKISPNGTYISFIYNENNIRKLAFLDAKTYQATYVVRFSGDEEVGSYEWVNDERVALEKVYNRGWKEEPEYYGEIFSVNADGKKATYLFGQKHGGQTTGSRLHKNTAINAIGYIRHGLPANDKYMLIKAYPFNNGTSGFMSKVQPQLYKVNVYSGKRKKIATAPITNANFILNKDLEPTFVSGTNSNNETHHFQLIDKKWSEIDLIRGRLNNFSIISVSDKADHIYAEGFLPNEKQALFEINTRTGKQTKIVSNDNVEPQKFWVDDNTNELYAVEFEDGYPEYAFVNKEHNSAKQLKSLLSAIPGHQLHLLSKTLDGHKSIVAAFNDRNPSDYYVYNSKKNEIKKILAQAEWLNPDDLADVKPISFKSRDGLTIHGFITMPYGIEHKNLPLVVNPHGGPIARDYWGYNSQAQFLAQQGIATLQINFRSSSGYGLAFEKAGNENWGTKVQYDIIDGTRYAINQGWINKDKICIEGGSFGAYSAIQSAIIEPDMFKCAIGVAGVYDLTLMKEEGDIPSINFGSSYLNEVLGNDQSKLQAMSPAHNVNKLKAKILLVHGKKDKRTPIEQYEALEDALNSAQYSFEKMIFDKEGHGLFNPENRAKYYKKMHSFLKENLAL
ncbi:S9 family peptidase [Parashewanella spongiae]|uniref:S9 family peptidase n=1 Tax=Parashewanella spongiae TaxID=342950 RepID=A0A3A6UB02_9GAMM|nr:prolyl oligopeptidase family serine peptidase [Parashewanella spongiae]MCL1077033.1 prolyl oligopeptidase family serine peptidase [Parashewanella spongiae]RJY18753.1 S9 family peptidase [Parashewanella spongiae]